MAKKLLAFLLALVIFSFVGSGLFIAIQSRGLAPTALEAKYMTTADRFVEIDGVRVRVREEGPASGAPIVLVHGFTFSLETWDAWARSLARDYRVIRYDLAGHGLTGPDPARRYSPMERAEFLSRLFDELELGPAVIAGNSLGGMIAWRFAAMNPERVAALVLVSPSAYPLNGVGDEAASPPPAMQAFLKTAPEAGVAASVGFIYADASKVSPKRLELLRDMMRRRGNGDAFVQSIEQFVLPDPTNDLRSIAAPTLIMWGSEDRVVPPEHGDRLAADIPGSKLVTFQGAGHVLQEEAPEETLTVLRDFLGSSAAGLRTNPGGAEAPAMEQ